MTESHKARTEKARITDRAQVEYLHLETEYSRVMAERLSAGTDRGRAEQHCIIAHRGRAQQHCIIVWALGENTTQMGVK